MSGHRPFSELRSELADKVGEERLAENERRALAEYDAMMRMYAHAEEAKASGLSLGMARMAVTYGYSRVDASHMFPGGGEAA